MLRGYNCSHLMDRWVRRCNIDFPLDYDLANSLGEIYMRERRLRI